MTWCEKKRVGYVFGLAKNERLVKKLRNPMQEAQGQWKKTGKPARRFRDFRYRTRKSWKRGRRVAGKAAYLDKGANPRFVVTSLGIRRSVERSVCGC